MKVTSQYTLPVPPKEYVITLNADEAKTLLSLLSQSATTHNKRLFETLGKEVYG